MTVREKMRDWRESRQVTFRMLSNRSGVSETLLSMVENGHVTHPDIAKKIGEAYGLNEEETWELMPVYHRPNHPLYDPTHFVSPIDLGQKRSEVILPPRDIMAVYIAQHQELMRKTHQRKGYY